MRLWAKFALLLGSVVLLAVGTTTTVTSRFFAADQEAYVIESQAASALSTAREIVSKFELLYLQVGVVLENEQRPLPSLISLLPEVSRATLWEKDRAIVSYPPASSEERPPQGSTRWAFAAGSERASVRWIGRYGTKEVSLELKPAWLSSLLRSERGAVLQLSRPDGELLASSGEARVFYEREIYERAASQSLMAAQSVEYQSPSGKVLGTFVGLPTAPPCLVTFHTPLEKIHSVVKRVYRYSTGIVLGFLVIMLGVGTLFASTLTDPLRTLSNKTLEIAKGQFDVSLGEVAARHDEVGQLARAFARMGTDLKKLKKELEQSARMVAMGRFSASIAHEVKNPLAGALCNIQLIQEWMKSGKKVEASALSETLGIAYEETWRANTIIMKLMKFARQEKPPQDLIDLSGRLQKSLFILKAQLEKAGVELKLELPEELVPCKASGDQIHEVLTNLIQNAIYAMKESPQKVLSVSLRKDHPRAVVEIRDTGAGIPKDIQSQLFEPFFTTKPIGEGTGLGLAVCRGIILNHLGKIELESEAGKGTLFRITLPISEDSIHRHAA